MWIPPMKEEDKVEESDGHQGQTTTEVPYVDDGDSEFDIIYNDEYNYDYNYGDLDYDYEGNIIKKKPQKKKEAEGEYVVNPHNMQYTYGDPSFTYEDPRFGTMMRPSEHEIHKDDGWPDNSEEPKSKKKNNSKKPQQTSNQSHSYASQFSTSDQCKPCPISSVQGNPLRPDPQVFDQYLPMFLKDNPDIQCPKAGHAAYGQVCC